MTTVGYNIPLDLMIEILLRLPGKSLFRFRCVSKTWHSIIRSRQFGDAFMSLSLSRPRLLLAFNHTGDNRLMFFSAPHQSSHLSSSSSSMVAAKHNTLTMPTPGYRFRARDPIVQSNSVRGFVCCSLGPGFAVCNPTTGQVINLPDKPSWSWRFSQECCYMYLAYDPINGQYKVLRLDMQTGSNLIGHGVCTLGGPQPSYPTWSWRRVRSSILYYKGNYNGVCIDGVVYFEVCLEPLTSFKAVSSFDVGSEQLSLLQTPENLLGVLTNYLGKLAAYHASEDGSFILWVLDDVKNQVWSKRVCVSSSFTSSLRWDLRVYFAGMTAAGEIVYVPFWFSDPFEVLCYHVEKKVERRVRVEGLVADIYDGLSSCITSGSRCFSSLSCLHVDNIAYL